MPSHLSRLPRPALALLLAAATLSSQAPVRPVLEAPMVVLSANSSTAIELVDLSGAGDWRGVSTRILTGPTSSWIAVYLVDYDVNSASASAVFSGYVPTSGPMIPCSDAGSIGPADAGGEAVVAVGRTVVVVDGYAPPQTWQTAETVLDAAVGDFDGDGSGDVALLTNTSVGGLQLELHLWNGAALQLATTFLLPPTAGVQLVAAETDGDGRDDLVVVGQRLQCFTYSAGSVSMQRDEYIGHATPMPVAGDIDGDGDVDLVVFDWTEYTVLRRTGPAAFAKEAPVLGGPATHLYDVDGDGDLDGACCSSGGGSLQAMNNAMTYRVSINEGGVFQPAYEMAGIGGYHLAGVADVDGNGFLDLVAGRTVFFAQRSLAEPPQRQGPGNHAAGHALFDADSDGDVDAVTTAATRWQNRGDGAFDSVAPDLPTPPVGSVFAPPVLPGDFDGDGDTDLIVEVRSNGAPVGTRLLLQRGPAYADGGEPFPAGITLSPWIGEDNHAVHAADLDDDGDLDLAINSIADVRYSMLWFNDGAGHLAATPLLGYVVMGAGDFTNDGTTDLLVSDGRLLLQRGAGGGAFLPPAVVYPNGLYGLPTSVDVWRDSVAIGDFDADGMLDVACGMRDPSGYGCSLEVLWGYNAGGYVFTEASSLDITYLNSAEAVRLRTGDFDGDGVDDLLVADPISAFTQGCGVMFGSGGVPSPYWLFRSYDAQLFIAPFGEVADLDADGDSDLVGERVVFNPQKQAPDAGLRRQWGTGTPGAGGVVPCLGARGVVAVNRPLDVVCSGAQGQTCGLLALGTTTWNVALFGGTSYVLPDATVTWCSDGVPGTPGDGRLQLPLGPLDPSLAGAEVHLQAALIDSAVGITLTNALTLRIGQ